MGALLFDCVMNHIIHNFTCTIKITQQLLSSLQIWKCFNEKKKELCIYLAFPAG